MGGPLFLRASAGSGKTYRLVLEYLKILLRKPDHFRSILAITFTNDATAEMKSRIRQELKKLSRQAPGSMAPLLSEVGPPDLLARRADEALQRILHDYSHFSVMTIDGFFQMVLRSFSRELKLPLGYAVELDSDAVLEYAIGSLLGEIGKEPNLTRWLCEYARQNLEEGKTWNIENQVGEVAKELFKEISQHREWEKVEDLSATLSAFQRSLRGIQHAFENEMASLGKAALVLTERFNITGKDVNRGLLIKYFQKIQNGDYDPKSIVGAVLFEGASIWTQKATAESKQKIEDVLQAGLQDIMNQIARLLEEGLERYNTAVIAQRHLYNLGILGWMQTYIRRYRNEENALMISDTLSLLGTLVSNENTPFIYEKIGVRYKHILIDEFQDTSGQQWNNLLPLVLHLLSLGGQVLVVGDAKQSIYRWRGGDMQLILKKAPEDLHMFRPVFDSLDTNYRSRKHIVGFNNGFFEWLIPTADPQTGGALSTVYEGFKQQVQAGENKSGGYAEVRFFERDDTTGLAPELQSLAYLVEVIHNCLARGYQAGDIGLLVRNNITAQEVAQVLVQHGIEVITPESLMLAGDERVKLMLAALRIVNEPGNTLHRVVAIQKYAIVHRFDDISDEDILEQKWADPRLSRMTEVFEKVNELSLLPLGELNEWLVQHLLPGVVADVFFLAWQDTVHRFISEDSARTGAFLEWWDQKGHTTTVQVPESPGAVKLMTIHKSKGLQFPVVILPRAEWTVRPKTTQLIWVDDDHPPYDEVPYIPVSCTAALEQSYFAEDYLAEKATTLVDNINMLYVALTRAIDELYLFCPYKEIDGKSTEEYTDVSHFLQAGIIGSRVLDMEEEEPMTFTFGEKLMPGIFSESGEEAISPETYRSTPLAGKTDMRTFTRDAAMQKGVAWHELLAGITREEQVAPVVKACLARQPEAAENETILEEQLRAILALEASVVPGEFDTMLAERDLLWNGEIIRPDKMYVRGNRCVIIDYKTGQESTSHHTQVKKYAQALTACGYAVVGAWLIYTDTLTLVSVNND